MRKIIIVGGGTAGWMTAAGLAFYTRGQAAQIQLIESEEIGIVGVGEATIPPIQEFNNLIGVDLGEFVRRTKATFKLGIEFVNWTRLGHRYFHQFGFHGDQFDDGHESVYLHHHLMKLQQNGDRTELADYCLEAVAARQGRFALPDRGVPMMGPPLQHAYQFDASLYGRYMRDLAEAKGVQRIEGKITEIHQHGEDGSILGVTLQNGTRYDADFFVDCSGFQGLLIEKTLKSGFEDWSHWLPCDRAFAVPCESVEDITPFTRSTAHKAGWQWRIPLQHRTGNGHVFCGSFMSEDEAAGILLKNLDGRPLADPRLLKFTAGRRKKMMNKNVAAIGLASGFLEPLESTSIHLVQTCIQRLGTLFPLDKPDPATEREYNRLGAEEYEHIRDFIILHYCATERADSPFWNHCRTMELPDSLQHRIELFKSRGRVARHFGQLFKEPSWVAVFLGQGIIPEAYHPLVDAFPLSDIKQSLGLIRERIQRYVPTLPRHRDFLASAFAPEAPAGQARIPA